MTSSGDEQCYRVPPAEIAEVVDAPPPPEFEADPTGVWLLLKEREALVSIAEQARSQLRLAGIRFDPGTNCVERSHPYTRLTLLHIPTGEARPIGALPTGASIDWLRWSPDGKHFACGVLHDESLSLWIIETQTAEALQCCSRLNSLLGTPFVWEPDGQALLALAIPPGRGEPPRPPQIPTGPIIQETRAGAAPARTYQDLLKNPYDEELFAYYATSELVRVALDGGIDRLGCTGLIRRTESSPDGRFILVDRVNRPFSYLVPWYRFPHTLEVLDRTGRPVRRLAELPLAEEIPIGVDAVPQGPRHVMWRSDADATLLWTEAQDGGDPRVNAPIRDRLFSLGAPFEGEPQLLTSLELRFAGIQCGDDSLMVVHERWWRERRIRTWHIDPSAPERGAALWFDRSFEDRYNDPGTFLMRRTERGTRVLLSADGGQSLFLVGAGASPEGDRPFLDRFDTATQSTQRLWQSQPPHYERPIRLIDPTRGILLTSQESVSEPPNAVLRELATGAKRRLTRFEHPTPQLAQVHKELLRYQRADGVELTATLYLPPGAKPGDPPRPLLLWAYPREFKNADAAGQVRESPYRFVRLSWASPLYMLMAGYAVLDGPSMPIIGVGEQEANDTYVQQLAASAQAAVDEVVRRGVAHPDRIAVGGHSYGGFMTANLLAHTDLFCAGIARSGAYNRTLTPFGFQSEERTLWEAPDVYFAMSAFVHADKISAPLLLIHGDADDNAGTFPMQSERFYNALKGLGVTARLVMLPHESHHYRARESVKHMLWEMHTWLERHAKGTRALSEPS